MKGSATKAALLLGLVAAARAQTMAGYVAGNTAKSVLVHASVDLDQDAMNVAVSASDFSALTAAYGGGGNSIKTKATCDGTDIASGCIGTLQTGNTLCGETDSCTGTYVDAAIRTLKGFSTGLDAKACPATKPDASADAGAHTRVAGVWDATATGGTGGCIEDMWANQKAYWGSTNGGMDAAAAKEFGNTIVSAALAGTGDYAGKVDVLRKEVAVKTSAYTVATMYAIHEMEDAIYDCEKGTPNANTAGVHAWDEAVAFYAGSLEGQAAGGASAGEMGYRLAEKRCKNYGTCSGGDGITGTSNVNVKIMAAFDTGKTALQAGTCAAGAVQMEIIKKQMKVPLVQGMLRYAYKADPSGGAKGAKEIGEGWAFATAILGEINKCSPTVAATVRANMDIAASGPVADGYQAVIAAVQTTYECMGITCEDVGGLLLKDVGTTGTQESYFAGHGVCCSAADTPYVGCTAPTCTGVDTPWAPCTVPDCTDTNVPYAGCTAVTCAKDESVTSKACVSCATGKVNAAGDDKFGADTACAAKPAPVAAASGAATTVVSLTALLALAFAA